MANFFPKLEIIKKLKQPPTNGEWYALNILKNLPDEFEVYFQPFINGNNPDIIILRKNYGVIIIEVKDWQLVHYYTDSNNNWFLKKNNIPIKSPIAQVKKYKNNLYNLSIPSLLERGIIEEIKQNEKRHYGLIKNVVFFYNESKSSLNSFIERGKFDYIYGKNDFTENVFVSLLKYKNELFDVELYYEFQRVLKPSFHTLEQAKEIELKPKQEILAVSEKKQQKIRGVAGSGKTVVLAQRAVNAHIRHGGKVLILTYNITLRNYIHDNINRVRKEFDWKYFYIIHYDAFIFTEANNYNIKNIDSNNINLFENVKDKIAKYESIFIDEIQDYQEEWIKIIKKYFLVKGGEFVVFGDEKQNIYDKELDDDKKPYTGVGGRYWSVLNESHRLSNKILDLAEKFQAYFFTKKYELDRAIPKQQILPNFEEDAIEYYKFDENETLVNLSNFIIDTMKKDSISPQDVCILAHSNTLLRELDFKIRQITKQKTYTTFETKEIFEHIKNGLIKKKKFTPKNFDDEIRAVRRNKRFNFWMNSGGMKLSTVHSFKGWEIDTLFLIIDNKSKHATDEVIYTALTRCRNRLIIINFDNPHYDDFFKDNIKSINTIKTKIKNDLPKQRSNAEKTIKEIVEEDLKSDFYYNFHRVKSNKKFNILIMGEITGSIENFKERLNSHLSKFDIKAYEWDIDLWNNKTIKKKNLKSLKKGQSKYSLIITGQIYHHSSKGNKEQNLLIELNNMQYIDMKYGCKPQSLLTIDNFVTKIDEYINEVE